MMPRADRRDQPRVALWTDVMSGWVERHPELWLGLGNWETRLLSQRLDDIPVVAPIYIAGLARSGSTILLESLSRHPDLTTHRYQDFPLVPTPWLWNWFITRAATKPAPARERAHRDRIKVTPQSPEAFEEVIWMAFFPRLHDPSVSAILDGKTANPAFEVFYRDHIRKLLLLRGGSRYLAKGNYNVTRLAYLLKLFPDARFIVPIRDPVWHIASLMKQHALFCAQESVDPRVLRHMRRSGHFEFGLDRRPINVGDADVTKHVRQLWHDGEEIEGWTEYWSLVYGHVGRSLEASPALRAATLIVWYEDLCARPAGTMADILAHCGLSEQGLTLAAQATISPPSYYEPAFTAEQREFIRLRTRDTARLFPRANSAARQTA